MWAGAPASLRPMSHVENITSIVAHCLVTQFPHIYIIRGTDLCLNCTEQISLFAEQSNVCSVYVSIYVLILDQFIQAQV